MMKMMVVLVLSCVLCVSAESQHGDINISGCSDHDGEEMYGLDGEQIWFADFDNKRGVYPLPPFSDHFRYEEGVYQNAVANQDICKSNLKVNRGAYKDIPLKQFPPSSPMIYTRNYLVLGQKNTLICHVTGFYPAPVNVSWTKNEQKVTLGTSINVPYPNKDGTFHQISRLDFTPQQGDFYSCSVQHPALEEPVVQIWEVEVQQPSVGPAVFCGVGLVIGLLGVAAGTFFLIKGNECS